MTALTLVEKTCTKCSEIKPLSEFYRQTSSRDGHTHRCKLCTKAAVRASIERRRDEMGDEAWLARQVEIQRKHRASDAYDRTPSLAYNRAIYELRRRHPDEFQALLRLKRYELGLDPDSKESA